MNELSIIQDLIAMQDSIAKLKRIKNLSDIDNKTQVKTYKNYADYEIERNKALEIKDLKEK